MMNTVTIAGTVRGSMTLKNIPNEDRPSMTAASSISPGMERMNAAKMMTEKGIALAT
ncbi:hypothetical protein D3C81_1227050 [compost metagenome]